MATRLEKLEGVFKERVLPDFPHAKERFGRHFSPSCELVSMFRGPGKEPLYLNMDFAFVVLGLKPMAVGLEFDAVPLDRLGAAIRQAGLGLIIRRPPSREVDIFDPVLASGPLSRMLNRSIAPENAGAELEDLKRENRVFPAYLFNREILGLPEGDKPLEAAPHFLRVFSLSLKYTSISVVGIYDAAPILPSLPARAAAAALIEDIRESPQQIVSVAALASGRTTPLEILEKAAVVRRNGSPGEWPVVEASHMPSFAVMLPGRLFRALALASRMWPNGTSPAVQSPCSSPADFEGISR